MLRAALQYALARYTIIAITMVPFAALALLVFQQRQQPLVALLTGVRPLLLAAVMVAGLMAIRLRQAWLDSLDRRFFREGYDARQVLDRLMSDARDVTDARDLARRLRRVIDGALHAEATLFVVDDTGTVCRRAEDGGAALETAGVLFGLAMADAAPMDVNAEDPQSPVRRLSPAEQRWLQDGGARLLLPMTSPGGQRLGLITLSSKQSGLPLSEEDRRLLSAVAASASLALDNLRLRSSSSDVDSSPAAQECRSCSRVNASTARACECGGVLAPALAPHILRGKFRLDRRIGAGGMGVVYHAIDLELGRSVAIKTLPRVTADHADRLRREARAMAVLTHANLAIIHGLETWQGVPFLIVEFLAAGTLSDQVARGRLPLPAVLDLGLTLAAVLDYLHGAGVIHRDIKPSNIGFTRAGVVKVLDFGLARLASSSAEPGDTTSLHGDRTPTWSLGIGPVGTPQVHVARGLVRPAAVAGLRPLVAVGGPL